MAGTVVVVLVVYALHLGSAQSIFSEGNRYSTPATQQNVKYLRYATIRLKKANQHFGKPNTI